MYFYCLIKVSMDTLFLGTVLKLLTWTLHVCDCNDIADGWYRWSESTAGFLCLSHVFLMCFNVLHCQSHDKTSCPQNCFIQIPPAFPDPHQEIMNIWIFLAATKSLLLTIRPYFSASFAYLLAADQEVLTTSEKLFEMWQAIQNPNHMLQKPGAPL